MAGSSPDDRPLGPDEIDAAFADLADERHLLLAVSGGPDSLALLIAVRDWLNRADERPQVSVATVDHGLRAESAAEALAVARLCAERGLRHEILVWTGEKPRQGLQEAARAARYRLLAQAAQALGAGAIVTAHHRDDQAETVLMRLAAGSGIAGLAAMRGRVPLPGGPMLARPLLAFPKSRLIATVAAAGLAPADDPSNRDPRYARVRLRAHAAQAAAAQLGLTPGRLARLAERAERADAALAAVAEAEFARLAAEDVQTGTLLLGAGLFELPEELVLRVLERALHSRGTERAPLRLERLEALVTALCGARRAGAGLRRTLGGAIVSLDARGRVGIACEPPRRRGKPTGHGSG